MGLGFSRISRVFDGEGGGHSRRKGSPVGRKGYVPVYVGANDEMKRFMVHTTSLGDAEFMELLCKSAEEYGFCNQGVLRIPYDAKMFEEWMLRRPNWKKQIRTI